MGTSFIYYLPPLKSQNWNSLILHCLLLSSVLFWETGLQKSVSYHEEFIAGVEEENLLLPMLPDEPPCLSLLFQHSPKQQEQEPTSLTYACITVCIHQRCNGMRHKYRAEPIYT